jgi:hypothetical protein
MWIDPLLAGHRSFARTRAATPLQYAATIDFIGNRELEGRSSSESSWWGAGGGRVPFGHRPPAPRQEGILGACGPKPPHFLLPIKSDRHNTNRDGRTLKIGDLDWCQTVSTARRRDHGAASGCPAGRMTADARSGAMTARRRQPGAAADAIAASAGGHVAVAAMM